MNKHISNRLNALRKILMAHYEGGANLPNALKGAEREVFIREFLAKMFPKQIRFTSGVITDSRNNLCELSGQIDIIMELPFHPSFPLLDANQRLILAESVAAIIEVKSDITSQWNQVRTTIQKIKTLVRELDFGITHQFNILDYFGISFNDFKKRIPCFVVSYKGHKNISSLERLFISTPDNERPDGVLVIENGYFICKNIKEEGEKGLYVFISLLTGIFNSILSADPNVEKYIT